ncbi:3-beta hydroxysteroid dehydrogenase/isomerase family-domain-containing protein [Crucibulum laeve]|uniref:3-beta hydroxysteroid dehydrogenase/isomerase family-domain-containing protein n=1 Tax=Crucibulum laeve TaxID=68775 RepID=A0A5C3M8E6_9AGAR|nr:3-beta hydroxysteroid dehydrogenase/isomerase family-domain-containing protein [Crucibulum laeve]
MAFITALTAALTGFTILVLYIRHNDKCLLAIPERVQAATTPRITEGDVRETAARLEKEVPLEEKFKAQLPPKTGRRYIIVGGGGFLGGWIATALLHRGEDPRKIRLLDLNPPTNYEVVDAVSKGTQFLKVDVTDTKSVEEAFSAPWAATNSDVPGVVPEVTIFHTAANIRFYERHRIFLSRSTRVNVQGTENVVKAAKDIGATVLVYTSSGSVAIKRARFWLWPWEKEPAAGGFVHAINDDQDMLPKVHEEFFSNYAVTKMMAESIVRGADKSRLQGEKVLRTGCLRPGNGIFGPRGDMLCGAYLVRETNPTWIQNSVQSFIYVENCALSHLLYERRLIDTINGSKNPDIGGQAFCIADPGKPPTYGDVYNTLSILSGGETTFPELSPTAMLAFAHVVESYYIARHYLIDIWGLPLLGRILPAIQGDIINLQPSLFALTQVHLLFDDSRARLSPQEGGLGYQGAWTTLEGLHKTFREHKNGVGWSSRSGKAGVSFGFKKKKVAKASVAEAQAAVGKIEDKMMETIGIGPVEMFNPK